MEYLGTLSAIHQVSTVPASSLNHVASMHPSVRVRACDVRSHSQVSTAAVAGSSRCIGRKSPLWRNFEISKSRNLDLPGDNSKKSVAGDQRHFHGQAEPLDKDLQHTCDQAPIRNVEKAWPNRCKWCSCAASLSPLRVPFSVPHFWESSPQSFDDMRLREHIQTISKLSCTCLEQSLGNHGGPSYDRSARRIADTVT
jgi:hypothetical protein